MALLNNPASAQWPSNEGRTGGTTTTPAAGKAGAGSVAEPSSPPSTTPSSTTPSSTTSSTTDSQSPAGTDVTAKTSHTRFGASIWANQSESQKSPWLSTA